MTASQDGIMGLTTQKNELVKQHIVLDGNLRATIIYTAGINTLNNGPCTTVRYQYSGTTNIVTGMMEGVGTWLTAWEF